MIGHNKFNRYFFILCFTCSSSLDSLSFCASSCFLRSSLFQHFYLFFSKLDNNNKNEIIGSDDNSFKDFYLMDSFVCSCKIKFKKTAIITQMILNRERAKALLKSTR